MGWSRIWYAVNSGTAALHTALLACDIGPGDEVITTPFTFIASGNSIVYTGAKPVFADIDLKTYTLSPDAIEGAITENTKAIMPVQLYGRCRTGTWGNFQRSKSWKHGRHVLLQFLPNKKYDHL